MLCVVFMSWDPPAPPLIKPEERPPEEIAMILQVEIEKLRLSKKEYH